MLNIREVKLRLGVASPYVAFHSLTIFSHRIDLGKNLFAHNSGFLISMYSFIKYLLNIFYVSDNELGSWNTELRPVSDLWGVRSQGCIYINRKISLIVA